MTVLVTGATGFVGRHLLDALSSRGVASRAALRTQASAGCLAPGTDAVVTGDAERADWARALIGVDVVVHLAARVHQLAEGGSTEERSRRYHDANVAPTGRLAEAALRAGVRRFVFVSTVKVIGEGRGTPYRDADAPQPSDPYARSKLEAEQLLAGYAVQGFQVVILRPPLVHGAGVGGNFLRLLRLAAVSTKVPLPLGGIRNHRSLVFAENLADALATASTAPGAVSGSYLVADAPPIGTSELLTVLAAAVGRRARLFSFPGLLPLLRALGRKGEVSRLTGDLTVDDSRFRRAFAWIPPVEATAGLEKTARAWDGW